jgi:dihydrofolate reductase
MVEIRGFIASTLDGYIASLDGSIDWLKEFGKLDYGYDAFIAQIDTVVVGRRTYDQIQQEFGWPYGGKRALIVSHRDVDDLPERAESWSGEIAELVIRLRETSGGDVWVVGGSDLQQQFLDADGLDRFEVHLIPLLLGDGIPLWPRTTQSRRLNLTCAMPMAGGMVRLEYSIRSGGRE